MQQSRKLLMYWIQQCHHAVCRYYSVKAVRGHSCI